MRQAIISDIHANLTALDAVMDDIGRHDVDEILCLGDIVGYGPDPVECVDMVRTRCKWCICGNHDAALFMTHPIGFNKYAREAIEWHRSVLLPGFFSLPSKFDRWKWLESLPDRRIEGDRMFVHGSPRDPVMEYVGEEDVVDMGFGPSDKIVRIFEMIERICFVGHSHKPGVVCEDYKWIKPADLKDYEFRMPENGKVLVNIGSVGQPRDRIKDACYVIFDGEKVLFRRVPYDVEKVRKRIAENPRLDSRLGDRLLQGS
ncbi:MAG: metallophosphatase family protein [Planctomycetota bacterium]|nr:metallophosphatase family protein [Planctomycetota bacterium]